jgi:hypothetical protein
VTASHWAHLLGLLGELLNLAGAIVLANDLVDRDKEENRREYCAVANQWAVEVGLKSTYYLGCNVAARDFVRTVLNLRSRNLGYIGLRLLVGGFALLCAYHFVEILNP